MNFKTLGLGAIAATAVSVGMVTAAPQAQAASLANGSFELTGRSSINATSTTDPEFSLSFQNLQLKTSESTGVFSFGLTGSPTAGPLGLRLRSGTTDTFDIISGFNNFITGLSKNGKAFNVSFAQGSFLQGSIFAGAEGYALFGSNLVGKAFFTDGTGTVPAQVGTGAVRFAFGTQTNNEGSIGVETIPTPALLPGLVGLGMAAFRKRNSQEEAVETVEAEA